MNKTLKTRGLSLLLALILCFSAFSICVFADEEPTAEPEESAQEEIQEPQGETEVSEESPEPEETPVPEVSEETQTQEAEAGASEEPAPEAVSEEPAAEEVSEEPVSEDAPAEVTEVTVPTITGIEIDDANSVAANSALTVTVSNDLTLSGVAVSLTTSEAVTFVPQTSTTLGELYVKSASEGAVTLAFYLGSDVDCSISLTSSDRTNWSGSFSTSYDGTAETLAEALQSLNPVLAAGSMVSDSGGASPEYKLYLNVDAAKVRFVFAESSVSTHTVTYTAGSSVYTWTVPSGATLEEPTVNLTATQTIAGWYFEDTYVTAVSFTETVTADTNVYAKFNGTDSEFLEALSSGKTAVISDLDDWNTFVANSTLAVSGQWVALGANIDCNGATYSSISFAGNFDGGNFEISDATFSAVSKNSGMFATLGAGQIVCNLTLNNVTASYAGNYAGALVGCASGSETNPVTIQNVQVKNSSVRGRSAGGVAGFMLYTDMIFCSSRDTTITGVANGGGICGINYGTITECYSTCSPTALSTVGGIAGKNLEGGIVSYCWTTSDKAVGSTSGATTTNVLVNVTDDTESDTFDSYTSNTYYWNTKKGTNHDFKKNRITYVYTTAATL